MSAAIRGLLVISAMVVAVTTITGRDTTGPGQRVLLAAHNCFPENGLWTDRISRALALRLPARMLEFDLAWRARRDGGESVVSHGVPITSDAPTFEQHFFVRLRDDLDRALAAGRRDTWPLYVVYLDFKTTEGPHLRAVWDLLGRYDRWVTTSRRGQTDAVEPLDLKPVLVLTDQADQNPTMEQRFHDALPPGASLRIFGTMQPLALPTSSTRSAAVTRFAELSMRTLAPAAGRIPGRATNFRRWVNVSWDSIELGGPLRAGTWTEKEHARLEDFVTRAHRMGLWIRVHTINGHDGGRDRGWFAGNNVGSLEEARIRWRAAIAAGADFIATDQYEELATELARASAGRR